MKNKIIKVNASEYDEEQFKNQEKLAEEFIEEQSKDTLKRIEEIRIYQHTTNYLRVKVKDSLSVRNLNNWRITRVTEMGYVQLEPVGGR